MSLGIILAVFVAGALGSGMRYWLAGKWPAKLGQVPRGLLIANLSGSALAGVFFAMSILVLIPRSWLQVLIAGFCGGLTTLSAWAIDVVRAAETNDRRLAVRNLLWTVLGSVLLFAATMLLTLWVAVGIFAVIMDGS
ncbi:MAG TPA: CrcB family protein [Microbacteriaceae bacterium]|nr:CrcB family protein [Microbacteriaceae bacterium]